MVSLRGNRTDYLGRTLTHSDYVTKEELSVTAVYFEERIDRLEKELRTYQTEESLAKKPHTERVIVAGKDTNQIRASGTNLIVLAHFDARDLYTQAAPTASLAVAAIGVLLSIGLWVAGRLELLLASAFLAVAFSTLGALQWHVQRRLHNRSGQQGG